MAWVDPNRPHAVYRIYDERGRLVYIGCSVNPDARIVAHRSYWSHTWGREDFTVTVEWHPDMATGKEAEAAAIKSERPISNTAHHPSKPSSNPVRVGRPPHREWELVWSGPDDPPWVATEKAVAAGTLRF